MIVTTLIVVLLVLLTVAVVVLFAMMGELANRTADHADTGSVGEGPVHPLEETRSGELVAGLPATFNKGPGVVVIFSTSCRACGVLAPAATEFFTDYPVNLIGVLVTTAGDANGADFVARHRLDALPVVVDVEGNMATSVFGIASSPAAVAVGADGVIIGGVAFTSYSSLTRWFDEVFGPVPEPVLDPEPMPLLQGRKA
ncbi:hypothetical protein [Dactylosporangium sp. CA-139066]|uniref:hypothetical protein n=1 Tax=Dactylosporangium sp. CA-139066 TaxID=3239930 RepID=UPI003D8DA92A